MVEPRSYPLCRRGGCRKSLQIGGHLYPHPVKLNHARLPERRLRRFSSPSIVDAVNRHQRTDKGFGPALGPSAAQTAIEAFERVGYTVSHGLADWEFGPTDREIQMEVLSGWAGAAREIGDPPLSEIVDWLERRRGLIAAGRSSLRVGHVDLLACPTGML